MAMNWSKELDKFYIDLKLEQGKFYQYKFVVDGKWVCDMNSETSIDVNGNLNNIIFVPYLNRNADPEFETEASTEDEQYAGESRPRARQEIIDNLASRRRLSSNATQQSGQPYLPSGGQGSTRKMSGSTVAFDDGNSYRQETAYKSGDLQKWEQQESLSRQSQMPRKSSKQLDYSEEYAKQGKREPATPEPRIRANDGYSRGAMPSEVVPSEHNRRPSQTGSESGHTRSRSRGGSFHTSEREIQMEHQSLQPEATDSRGRSYSPSNQVQAPLPGYVYQTRQFMPVGPQLREHEAKRGSLSRSSGIAARHVSFDPATLAENYDSVDASEPEYQQSTSRRVPEKIQVKGASQMRQPEHEPEEDCDMDQRYGTQAPVKEKYLRGSRQAADEGLNPANARRQGYPPHAAHNPGSSEVSQDFECYPNDSIAPEDYDEQIMQTRSQVKSHRRNRFGQGSAGPTQDLIQGYSDPDSSDAMDFGGVKPVSITPLRYSQQDEEVQIPQPSPRRDSVNSASFPRGRKPSNPSINYPASAMAVNGEEVYNNQGYSSKGRQGGSHRLGGSSRPASRLQIPTEFMTVKNQTEAASYSRNDFNETSESGTDTMEMPYEGQSYSNVYPKKGYPSETPSGRSPGSVGRKGSNPVSSYSPGRNNADISDRYRQPGFTAAEQGSRNDIYVESSANMNSGRRRSNTEQEYTEATARPRRRSKADQYEYAESASGKSAIYFDPVTGKFVRSYATQLVDNAPVNQEYNDVPGGRRRRSNTERAEYYDPSSEKGYSTIQDIDSNRYEARAGRNRRSPIFSQGAHEDVADQEYHKNTGINPRSGRRRSSTQQADHLESAAPKSAGILKKDMGAHPATGRSGRGSVSSQGAREDNDDRDYHSNAGGSSRSGRRRPSAQTNSTGSKPTTKGSNATARFDPTTGRFIFDSEPLPGANGAAANEHESKDDIKQEEENNVNQHPSATVNPDPTLALPQEHRESAAEDANQTIPANDQVNEPAKPVIGYYDPKLGRFVYAAEAPVEITDQEPPSQHAETYPSRCHNTIPDQSTQTSIAQGSNTKEEASCADIDPSVGHYDPVAKKFVCGFSHQSKADAENVAESINNIEESKQENVTGDVAAGPGYFDPTTGRFTYASSNEACSTQEGSKAQANASTEEGYQSLNTNDGFSVGLSMLSEGPNQRSDNEEKTSYGAPPSEISTNEPEESSAQTIASEGASSEEKLQACPTQAVPSSLRRVFDPLSGKFVYTEAPPSNQASASVSRGTPAQLSRRTTGLNNYVAASHSGLGDTENAEVSHDESVYQVSTPAAERTPSGGYFDASTGRFADVTRYIQERKIDPVPTPAVAKEPESVKPAEAASSQTSRYFDADSGRFVTGTAPSHNVSLPVPVKQTSYPVSTGVKADAAPLHKLEPTSM
ncbi:hypothetical protein DSO57_1004082 [Entomophthora muscae]|uniref:Uncharacterized protein n=1 Tax=Entomophthora muscae TaxID=34485 RepID=A0ACC2SX55_9FUNG|nr:hypothetical protein DSO57_1004082 [Entomophthora muscae]